MKPCTLCVVGCALAALSHLTESDARFPALDEDTIGEMLRDNGGHMERTCEQV